jgi:predicted neutral ceramidase superfamily lipid hydrolase
MNPNTFINNKPLFLNTILIVAVIMLLLMRSIPLAIILFVALMVEVDIIIALKSKGNVMKSFLYSTLFMTIAIGLFLISIFSFIGNDTFRSIITYVI